MRIIFYILWFIAAGLMSCSKNDDSTAPVVLYEFEKDFIGGIGVGDSISAILLENQFGGMMVTGWSADDSIRIYMQKKIKAVSEEEAESFFNDFSLEKNIDADSLQITVTAPGNTAEVEFSSCSLLVEIPYTLACNIMVSNGFTFTDQLYADLFIAHSSGPVQVQYLSGSCRVQASGDISVKMLFPAEGVCRLFTTSGDILLEIPLNTSAEVTATASDGVIRYSGLSFSSVEISGNQMTGVLGNGNGVIDLASEEGDISLEGFLPWIR